MRSDALQAFNMVKLINYQAFVCSTLLVFGLLGYKGSTHQTANQDKDRDLIGLAISTLRQASGTVDNPVASQVVQGLETLMSSDQGKCSHNTGTARTDLCARVVVPHIGTITISPGKYFSNSRPESTPPDIYPLPVLALSHAVFQGVSGQVNQTRTLTSNTGLDSEQVSEVEFGIA
jgi:hypothetical protein